METVTTAIGRRSFLKTTALAGGGLLIGFNWLVSCGTTAQSVTDIPEEWFDINAYLKISTDGKITIMAPNPEFGQNVTTSLPMIVAEELDADWKSVTVEAAPFNTSTYRRQFAGGSQSVQASWNPLRMAGASARYMLVAAAANKWGVPGTEITTKDGILYHEPSKKSAGYGAFASEAATITVPAEPSLKKVGDFKIIGSSRHNVRIREITSGTVKFGIDYKEEGMFTAMIIHPPAFGMELESFDATQALQMKGIKDVFSVRSFKEEYARAMFDEHAFPHIVAIVGDSVWNVMQAKKKVKVKWKPFADHVINKDMWGNKSAVTIPAGLESTEVHYKKMKDAAAGKKQELRKDGDPETAFKNAAKIIESTYTAPFLSHNALEPVNCFADARGGKLRIAGPTQAPEFMEETLAKNFNIPKENIDIQMMRMGGGFGRRAYSFFMVEAAAISLKADAPIQLVYTREDDMTGGIYRPSYQVTFRAALDKDNNLVGYHINGGGIPEHCISPNRFPAGAVDNYLAEAWTVSSNISVGAFRAPGSNFMGASEQAFFDEIAEAAGKDPIAFRLALLQRAKDKPVGKRNDYVASRYMGVLELVRDKSNWGKNGAENRGVAAYFCHNTYAAHVVEVDSLSANAVVKHVISAIDCGVVVNRDAATNMVEGAVVDGVGNALYGEMTFTDGKPDKENFHSYKMIRMYEAPKNIEVHFVESENNPTGLGEPPFPPVFAALANALYKSENKRFYSHPFTKKV